MVLRWLFGGKKSESSANRPKTEVAAQLDKGDGLPATDRQLAFLERLKVDVSGDLTKAQASAIISCCLVAKGILEDEYSFHDPEPEVVNVVTSHILGDPDLTQFAIDYERGNFEDGEDRPEYNMICDYIESVAKN